MNEFGFSGQTEIFQYIKSCYLGTIPIPIGQSLEALRWLARLGGK